MLLLLLWTSVIFASLSYAVDKRGLHVDSDTAKAMIELPPQKSVKRHTITVTLSRYQIYVNDFYS